MQYFSTLLSQFFCYLVQLLFALFILMALNWWMKPLNFQPKCPSLRRWKVLKLFFRFDAGRSDGYQVDPNSSTAFVATPTVSPNLKHKANRQKPERTDRDAAVLVAQKDMTSSNSTDFFDNSNRSDALQNSGTIAFSLSGVEDEGQPLELSEHSHGTTGEREKLISKEHSL